MEIRVKLFATLCEGLFEEEMVTCPDDATVATIVSMLGIPGESVAICLVNGSCVGRNLRLNALDTLALFPLVAGG